MNEIVMSTAGWSANVFVGMFGQAKAREHAQ